jgi:hypothetical protein
MIRAIKEPLYIIVFISLFFFLLPLRIVRIEPFYLVFQTQTRVP